MESYSNYVLAGQICQRLYGRLKKKLQQKADNSVYTYFETLVKEECHKSKLDVGISFPLSISASNCVGNYICDLTTTELKGVVKIHFGIHVNDCCVQFGETFRLDDTSENSEPVDLLNNIERQLLRHARSGELTSELRVLIESMCSEASFSPVENTVSQCINSNNESKFMILNYQKYYDQDDNLIHTNDVFELCEGEIYNINLTIVENDTDVVFKELHEPLLYRFNDYYYSLKLRSSKEFMNKVKKKYKNYTFAIHNVIEDARDRMGIRECIDGGILEPLPVLYEQKGKTVYSKKFTMLVKRNKSVRF